MMRRHSPMSCLCFWFSNSLLPLTGMGPPDCVSRATTFLSELPGIKDITQYVTVPQALPWTGM